MENGSRCKGRLRVSWRDRMRKDEGDSAETCSVCVEAVKEPHVVKQEKENRMLVD